MPELLELRVDLSWPRGRAEGPPSAGYQLGNSICDLQVVVRGHRTVWERGGRDVAMRSVEAEQQGALLW